MMRRCFSVGIVAVILTCAACHRNGVVEIPKIDSVVESVDTVPRTSITFILGKDHNSYNQYYTLANYYYRLNPDERTEIVVNNLKSLSQVLEYLRTNPTDNNRPYGLINLVTHGNEFIDLQMTIKPYGSRTSASSLRRAIADSVIVPLDSSIVDSQTIIYLHGCAVGNNTELLEQLAQAFGGDYGVTVKASKLFEYYAYLSQNKNPQSIHHYFAKPWYAFYSPDSVPDNKALIKQLKMRYPHDTANWQEGLMRRFQGNPSEIYHYSFEVPCTYEHLGISPEKLQEAISASNRQQWAAKHTSLRSLMAKTHIPSQYFQIKLYQQTYVTDNDSIAYGLKVRAKAGVICLLQPLTTTDSLGNRFMPYIPEDSIAFGYAVAKGREM